MLSQIDQIKELYQRNSKLREEIRCLANTIKPLEFESYDDYFLIHTFKKGISESGKVDIDDLRKREHTRYYSKIKHNNPSEDVNNINTDSIEHMGSSCSSSQSTPSEYLDDATSKSKKRHTRSKSLKSEAPSINESGSQSASEEENGNSLQRVNNVSAEISVTSIIDVPQESQSFRRRSSRISKKEENERRRRNLDKTNRSPTRIKQETINEKPESSTNRNGIHDLFESLVAKIPDPKRRSDWVLPPRAKYTPEKQMRTKAVFDSVKINELITNDRIQVVLSRFEGGVAGVRKRTWGSNN